MGLVVFGLTGGIGCGKSLIAAHWRSRGLPVVDADVLAREAVAPGTPTLDAIRGAFGEGVLQQNGELDRSALAARVFQNPEERSQLNAIVHPRVRELAQQRFRDLELQGEPLVCYEVPLLVETGQADRYRPLVVVSCSQAVQLARVAERDGSTRAQAEARVRSQMPVAKKAELADHVIVNDSTRQAALGQADAVLAEICRQHGIDEARYPLP